MLECSREKERTRQRREKRARARLLGRCGWQCYRGYRYLSQDSVQDPRAAAAWLVSQTSNPSCCLFLKIRAYIYSLGLNLLHISHVNTIGHAHAHALQGTHSLELEQVREEPDALEETLYAERETWGFEGVVTVVTVVAGQAPQ